MIELLIKGNITTKAKNSIKNNVKPKGGKGFIKLTWTSDNVRYKRKKIYEQEKFLRIRIEEKLNIKKW